MQLSINNIKLGNECFCMSIFTFDTLSTFLLIILFYFYLINTLDVGL